MRLSTREAMRGARQSTGIVRAAGDDRRCAYLDAAREADGGDVADKIARRTAGGDQQRVHREVAGNAKWR